MKRFLIFAYESCYPCGGWDDFVKAVDAHGEAMAEARSIAEKRDYVSVVDTQSMKEIELLYFGKQEEEALEKRQREAVE